MRAMERQSTTPAVFSTTPGPGTAAPGEPPKTAEKGAEAHAPAEEQAPTTAPGSTLASPAETPFTSHTKETVGAMSTPPARPAMAGVGPLPTPTITPSPPPSSPGRKSSATSASASRPVSRSNSRSSAKSKKKWTNYSQYWKLNICQIPHLS